MLFTRNISKNGRTIHAKLVIEKDDSSFVFWTIRSNNVLIGTGRNDFAPDEFHEAKRFFENLGADND